MCLNCTQLNHTTQYISGPYFIKLVISYLLSVTSYNNCFKLLKSWYLIGWEQIWFQRWENWKSNAKKEINTPLVQELSLLQLTFGGTSYTTSLIARFNSKLNSYLFFSNGRQKDITLIETPISYLFSLVRLGIRVLGRWPNTNGYYHSYYYDYYNAVWGIQVERWAQ